MNQKLSINFVLDIQLSGSHLMSFYSILHNLSLPYCPLSSIPSSKYHPQKSFPTQLFCSKSTPFNVVSCRRFSKTQIKILSHYSDFCCIHIALSKEYESFHHQEIDIIVRHSPIPHSKFTSPPHLTDIYQNICVAVFIHHLMRTSRIS